MKKLVFLLLVMSTLSCTKEIHRNGSFDNIYDYTKTHAEENLGDYYQVLFNTNYDLTLDMVISDNFYSSNEMLLGVYLSSELKQSINSGSFNIGATTFTGHHNGYKFNMKPEQYDGHLFQGSSMFLTTIPDISNKAGEDVSFEVVVDDIVEIDEMVSLPSPIQVDVKSSIFHDIIKASKVVNRNDILLTWDRTDNQKGMLAMIRITGQLAVSPYSSEEQAVDGKSFLMLLEDDGEHVIPSDVFASFPTNTVVDIEMWRGDVRMDMKSLTGKNYNVNVLSKDFISFILD